MASQPVEFEEFAACLRALRERAGLSYGALARKTHISSSSLHRYCSGSYVPQDYGSAHRFATACGASPEELRRLHRLWALADAAREPDRSGDTGTAPAPNPDLAPNSDLAPAPNPAPDSEAVPTPHPPWHRRKRSPALVVIALVLALGATAWGIAAVSGIGSPAGGDGAGGDGEGLLFSAECAKPVSLGQRGVCVREVQRLLARAGAELDVDGDFGPQTLRRVTAFQALSRIDADGVVGEKTKKALYAARTRMDSWSPGKVRQRVRKVFPEVPDRAVAVADCQSFLDPFHIVPNPDGTRNWGVFQISDATLRKLGGTPRDAMDPEWNIQAAHRLWSRMKNFGAWPHCDRASSPEAVDPALVQAVDDRPTKPAQNAPSSSPSATTVCPAPGQRFKTPYGDRVYLVGPGRRLYYVPDATIYFNLWDDWNGVAVVNGGVFADCSWGEAHELANAFLARTSGSSRAYLWDAWYGYRPITDRTVFDKYGFSETKIQTRPSLSPISGGTRWQ
ncbi:peptidoglycan hydrolase-like protein with peptidoglycan-binding domain/transcriptional regulator with XRE-family HTH domain [Streptomyces sp. V4I8]|uniref:helix-turn-helix domain-containing protein n=1 Tax=Streptomyces sp. V4I8 TaxID=3156469 RepID=UPI003511A7AA